MSAVTITITTTRALSVEGRLVAGEAADVSIVGAVPSGLYLVTPDQTIIAACESWTAGQSSGTGVLQLATEQVAALVANVPAGRMLAVWALVSGVGGAVVGAGWIPVISAPMPDALIDLNIDFYLRASQVGPGLAIENGRLVCTVAPGIAGVSQNGIPITPVGGVADIDAPLCEAIAPAYDAGREYVANELCMRGGLLYRARDVIFPAEEWTPEHWQAVGVVDVIPDVVPPDYGAQSGQAADAAETYAALQLKAAAADLRYALDAVPRVPDPETGVVELDDRTVNIIGNDGSDLTLVFPAQIQGRTRDFLVSIISSNAGTGNTTVYLVPYGAESLTIVNADGSIPDVPINGTTILYFSEVDEGQFLLKGETVTEAVAPTPPEGEGE